MEKKNVNRRNFLRMSAAAGAGALLSSRAAASAPGEAVTAAKAANYPMRMLGRTGIQLPILSMGVMRADNPNVVRAAYNAGITHFDTAHGYQNGRNEEMLGAFFKDKDRSSFYIATKGKMTYPLTGTFEQEFIEQFDLSLKRLQMNYVDWFYAHELQSAEQVKDPRLVAQLKKFKDEGKAKFIGFSMHSHKPEQIDAAIEAGIYDVILLSYNFKLGNIPETNAAIARAAKAGIGFIAMKTMTGGKEDAAGQRKVDGQACLKWVWQNEHITTAIPGLTSFEMLDDCIAAVGNPALSNSEKEYLAALCTQEGLFCQQCGQCRSQCPEGLPVPDLMRAYMYAYGYRHAQLSKETLAELDLPKEICSNCETCRIQCTAGFDVGGKIAAIMPVRDIPAEFLS